MFKSEKGCVSGGILSGSSQFWKKPAIWCFPAPQSYYEMLSKVCVDKLDSDNADASYLHTQTKKAGLLKPLVPHASLSLCTNKAGVIRLIRSSPAGFLTWPVKLPLPLPDQHFRRNMIWSVGGNLFKKTLLNIIFFKRGFNH